MELLLLELLPLPLLLLLLSSFARLRCGGEWGAASGFFTLKDPLSWPPLPRCRWFGESSCVSARSSGEAGPRALAGSALLLALLRAPLPGAPSATAAAAPTHL